MARFSTYFVLVAYFIVESTDCASPAFDFRANDRFVPKSSVEIKDTSVDSLSQKGCLPSDLMRFVSLCNDPYLG